MRGLQNKLAPNTIEPRSRDLALLTARAVGNRREKGFQRRTPLRRGEKLLLAEDELENHVGHGDEVLDLTDRSGAEGGRR